jgi:hypothetical protein
MTDQTIEDQIYKFLWRTEEGTFVTPEVAARILHDHQPYDPCLGCEVNVEHCLRNHKLVWMRVFRDQNLIHAFINRDEESIPLPPMSEEEIRKVMEAVAKFKAIFKSCNCGKKKRRSREK